MTVDPLAGVSPQTNLGERTSANPAEDAREGQRVWKFVLPPPSITGRSFIDMPAVVQPLSVAMQDGLMVVWALVDPDAEPEENMENHGPRRFIVANTGDDVDLPKGAHFLGTVNAEPFGVIWHIWDGDAETTV